MGCGSSSRGSSSHRASSRRRFHRVATNTTHPPPPNASSGRERHRVPVDTNEAHRLYRRYQEAPRGAKLPDGWHLNPNRVPIPLPPTGRERALAIADRKRGATPEQLADPHYAEGRPTWDELFQAEHEAARNSFAPYSPDWWLRDEDEDAATSDSKLYQRLPEEMPPPGWWKKGPDGAGNSSSAPVVID